MLDLTATPGSFLETTCERSEAGAELRWKSSGLGASIIFSIDLSTYFSLRSLAITVPHVLCILHEQLMDVYIASGKDVLGTVMVWSRVPMSENTSPIATRLATL